MGKKLKRIRMKKVISLGLCVMLLGTAFMGCGADGDDTAGDGDSASVGNEDVSQKEDAAGQNNQEDTGNGDEVTIKFGIHVADPGTQEPVTAEIVNSFNEKYKGQYRVEFEAAEKSAHATNLKLKASDGTLPQLFWVDAAEAPEYAEGGYLLDLTEFLGECKEVDAALDASTKDAFNDGSMQYGLPYQCNVEGFFYNKEIFKANGIEEPQNGTTYEEFLAMIQKLNAASVTPVAQGSTDTYAIWAFLAALDRYGYSDYIQDILKGEEKFNNENLVSCFEKLKELGESNAFPDNMSTLSYFDAKEKFKAGETAMFNTGAWDCSELDEALGEKVGFWWGPTFSDSSYKQERAMKVPSAPICVSAAVSEDESIREAVYAFLSYYYSEEAAGITYAGSAFPSTNFTGMEAAENQYALKAVMAALEDGWESPSAQPDLVISSSVQSQLYDSMLGVMLGNYEPEEALDKIDEQQAYAD